VSPAATNNLILIADDSISTLTLVSARLQRTGYDVVTATRGDDALTLAHKHRPLLVVLDLDMPGMDGITVAERLRADPSFAEVPIIMLTSNSAEEQIDAGMKAGADAYVVKPFSPQDLATRVDELLGRR
jgi:two-component system alkaline phosphatase synthesis response regulator PhoP